MPSDSLPPLPLAVGKSNILLAVCLGQACDLRHDCKSWLANSLQPTLRIEAWSWWWDLTPHWCVPFPKQEQGGLHSPLGDGVCSSWGDPALLCVPGLLVLAPSSASPRLWSWDASRCSRCDPVTMAAFSGPRFAICSGDNAWEEQKTEKLV